MHFFKFALASASFLYALSTATAIPLSGDLISARSLLTKRDCPLTVTQAAQDRLKQLIDEEDDDDLIVRVSVSGGGCSGLQYQLSFTDETSDDRRCDFENGLVVVVDSMSSQFLDGATIDFRDDMESSTFIITNPQCGAQEYPTEPDD